MEKIKLDNKEQFEAMKDRFSVLGDATFLGEYSEPLSYPCIMIFTLKAAGDQWYADYTFVYPNELK